MWKNYLKVALRNLWCNKNYTCINLFGLTVGIAATLLILIYILFEFSYDRFHENADPLYRISVTHKKEGKVMSQSPAYMPPIGPAMKAELPGVENYTRISTPRPVFVHYNNHSIRINDICYADSTFFRLLTFPVAAGKTKRIFSR